MSEPLDRSPAGAAEGSVAIGGDAFSELPFALGPPPNDGIIKAQDEDFQVEEILSFTPSGDGEHVLVNVEKSGTNTEFVARQLARFAGVPAGAVSYAGLKDRHGRTSQWFSVSLPGKADPDWTAFGTDAFRVIDVARNRRKLRRGAIAENRFRLVIRSLTGPRDELEARLQRIQAGGVPNYFGPQRFGHGGDNVGVARELLAGNRAIRCSRHQRGLYLSAARAFLFNRILAERVGAGSWNKAVEGDVFMFSTGHSLFHSDAASADIVERMDRMEIHAAGTLWGKGQRLVTADALDAEDRALDGEAELCRGLENEGLQLAMRPLRVRPDQMRWEFPASDALQIQFRLPSGVYATSVLRELIGMAGKALPEPAEAD